MDRPDPTPIAPEHLVHFYDEEAALIDSLVDYVGTGLATGRSCLVVATKDHRDALEKRLREAGLDLSTAQATGRYVAVDAADTLARRWARSSTGSAPADRSGCSARWSGSC
jgi:uroporphyrinogen-III synthase